MKKFFKYTVFCIFLLISIIFSGCKKEHFLENGLWIKVEDSEKFFDENGILLTNWQQTLKTDLDSCRYDIIKFDVTWQNKDEARGSYILYKSKGCYNQKMQGVFFFSIDKLEFKSDFWDSKTYEILALDKHYVKLFWDGFIFKETEYLLKLPKRLEKKFLENLSKNNTLEKAK